MEDFLANRQYIGELVNAINSATSAAQDVARALAADRSAALALRDLETAEMHLRKALQAIHDARIELTE